MARRLMGFILVLGLSSLILILLAEGIFDKVTFILVLVSFLSGRYHWAVRRLEDGVVIRM